MVFIAITNSQRMNQICYSSNGQVHFGKITGPSIFQIFLDERASTYILAQNDGILSEFVVLCCCLMSHTSYSTIGLHDISKKYRHRDNKGHDNHIV